MKTEDNNSTIDLSKHDWQVYHNSGKQVLTIWQDDNEGFFKTFVDIKYTKDPTMYGVLHSEYAAKDYAALIVKSVNNHFKLVEALKSFVNTWADVSEVEWYLQDQYTAAIKLLEQLK